MTEREFEKMIREHKGTIYTVCYMFSTDRDEVGRVPEPSGVTAR